MTAFAESRAILYEPDERCPWLLSLGVGVQGVMLVLASIVVTVAVTVRAGGQHDSYLAWALFAALIIAGALTALQASRLGRFGAGHILMMGPSLNFVAISALDEENLEDRLAYLSEEAEGARGLEGGEISLRLLRHYASSVHHQKYYGLDVVTVQVRGSR